MITDNARIATLRTQFLQARTALQEALAEKARGDVQDYQFATLKGPVMLSSLFGRKRDLFVIHNMGQGCNACTMWADGFNGLYPHIANRASFVVSNHETPEQQAEFAASRVSAFQMQDGKIVRASASGFNESDEFCPVWRLFDLLPEGPDGWRPQRSYEGV